MYKEKGVSSDGIKIDPTIHSGMSVIILDAEGRNLISVVPGANLRLNKDDIDRQAENIAASRIVGFQLESDPETVAYGIAKAHGLGVETLLDPAPVCPLPDEIFPNLTYIKPNEHEASLLTGIQVTDRLTASKAAKWLLGKGVKHVLITLGEAGCLISDSDGERFIDGIRVDPKDTTGAGDCFSGSFMFGLARGLPIDAAASFANCAASISVTRPSIVESYPTLGEVTARMKELGLASGGVLAKLEGGAK